MRPLEDIALLIVDVPAHDSACSLLDRLGDRWACCATPRGDAMTVIVFLPEHDAGYPQLLHLLEEWLHASRLPTLSFELRGRGRMQSAH